MGTKIDLNRLATALDDCTYAYLLTTGENGQPHAVAVDAILVGGHLNVADCGKRSRANALNRPTVALVYPPGEAGGYSLIVDGEATVRDDDLVVTPTMAVLHRPPRDGTLPSGSGCTSDCQRLEHG